MSNDQLSIRIPLTICSFGFRYCSPPCDDMRLVHIIDLRHLPRPWKHVDADSVRGTDAAFAQRLFENEEVAEFWGRALEAAKSFGAFVRECFVNVPGDRRGLLAPTIAFGCRSGRHRSVAFAERLLAHFKSQETSGNPRNMVANVHHRDISRVPSPANAATKFNIKCAACKVSVSTAKAWNQHIRFVLCCVLNLFEARPSTCNSRRNWRSHRIRHCCNAIQVEVALAESLGVKKATETEKRCESGSASGKPRASAEQLCKQLKNGWKSRHRTTNEARNAISD
eukprot:INCI18844.2.p1 GENE.INCI18844.2~~INCI18844.2.p1  ORF type:complete len:329 (-),score=24.72 INCI18844.2:1381-2226(-)